MQIYIHIYVHVYTHTHIFSYNYNEHLIACIIMYSNVLEGKIFHSVLKIQNKQLHVLCLTVSVLSLLSFIFAGS